MLPVEIPDRHQPSLWGSGATFEQCFTSLSCQGPTDSVSTIENIANHQVSAREQLFPMVHIPLIVNNSGVTYTNSADLLLNNSATSIMSTGAFMASSASEFSNLQCFAKPSQYVTQPGGNFFMLTNRHIASPIRSAIAPILSPQLSPLRGWISPSGLSQGAPPSIPLCEPLLYTESGKVCENSEAAALSSTPFAEGKCDREQKESSIHEAAVGALVEGSERTGPSSSGCNTDKDDKNSGRERGKFRTVVLLFHNLPNNCTEHHIQELLESLGISLVKGDNENKEGNTINPNSNESGNESFANEENSSPIFICKCGYNQHRGFARVSVKGRLGTVLHKIKSTTLLNSSVDVNATGINRMKEAREVQDYILNSKNYILRIRGIPFSITADELLASFDKVPVSDIANFTLCTSSDNFLTGDAFLELKTKEAYKIAKEYDRMIIGNRYLEVMGCSAHDRDVIETSARCRTWYANRGLYHAHGNNTGGKDRSVNGGIGTTLGGVGVPNCKNPRGGKANDGGGGTGKNGNSNRERRRQKKSNPFSEDQIIRGMPMEPPYIRSYMDPQQSPCYGYGAEMPYIPAYQVPVGAYPFPMVPHAINHGMLPAEAYYFPYYNPMPFPESNAGRALRKESVRGPPLRTAPTSFYRQQRN